MINAATTYTVSGITKNSIKLGRADNAGQANTHVGYGLLSVADAKNIDKRMDDGIARSGTVSGQNGFIPGGTPNPHATDRCLKFVATVASYYLGTDFLCNMSFDFGN